MDLQKLLLVLNYAKQTRMTVGPKHQRAKVVEAQEVEEEVVVEVEEVSWEK